METSKKYRINWRNIIKGGIYSATSAIAAILITVTSTADLSLSKIITVFFATFIGYCLPKFFQDENGNYGGTK